MTNARGDCLISNEKDKIYGLCFSPDFDTSQQMYISDFLKSIKRGECNVKKDYIKIDRKDVPVLILGKNANNNNDLSYLSKRVSSYASFDKEENQNVKRIQTGIGKTCARVTILDEEFLVESSNYFYVFVDSDKLIYFVANPYVFITKEDEVLQSKKYKKDCYLKLRRAKAAVLSYETNLRFRQNLFLKEIDNLFSILENGFKENGFVVGSARMILNSVYIISTGSKRDSEISLKENIFPYKSTNGIIERYTDEELNKIRVEKAEYERKQVIISKRLEILEEIFKSKKYKYTIISNRDIHFDNEGNYKVWMNAQSYEANYGWFKEQDFIDWVNMEGIIPFTSSKIKYWAEKLVELNPNIEFISIKDENLGCFKIDNIEYYFDEDKIKEEISKIKPIVRYTVEDLDKEYSKREWKHPIKKIKNIILNK